MQAAVGEQEATDVRSGRRTRPIRRLSDYLCIALLILPISSPFILLPITSLQDMPKGSIRIGTSKSRY